MKSIKVLRWVFFFIPLICNGQEYVFPGADEKTPSKSEYFSWINNTNEGPTEHQTLINLNFYDWLKREYGMSLDIYAFDAGAIDGKRFYGSIYSERFKKQFPNGFDSIYKRTSEMGIRLGVWGGPDGFGNSKYEEQARIDQMVRLCKDYNFALFKFDAVCGPLPASKEDAFIAMMKECRKYSPDLILLNHRLGLNKGAPYATTFLMEGSETYIDVFLTNSVTAPHNRAAAIARGTTPGLMRLTEDHGVCLSSCLDYWEDDLVLHAFNRSLILAPQLYGNPWLLRDDEFSQLSRLFNLHRKYREILVRGDTLPTSYGPSAVSRGNDVTRMLTLRNLTWESKDYTLLMNEEIGLSGNGPFMLVQLHPTEKYIGTFNKGEKAKVSVDAFRSGLFIATAEKFDEPLLEGSDYRVIRNVGGKPIEIELLGLPGTSSYINLNSVGNYKLATIDGKPSIALKSGKKVKINFPGTKLALPPHRKLADLSLVEIPEKVSSLYEATVYSADNNALEVRSLLRSGPTSIPEVQAARNELFEQECFVDRGIWDKNLFDGNKNTGFWPSRKYDIDQRVKGGCLRLDLGDVTSLDEIIIYVPDEYSLEPLLREEGNYVEVSVDLINWKTITYMTGKKMRIKLNEPIRYLRFKEFPSQIVEIEGVKDGELVNRTQWKASNLFAHSDKMKAVKVWSAKVNLGEVAKNSYLCVAINGLHGVEGAYAAAIIDGQLVGAPHRAASYPSNTWEYVNARRDRNYAYYIPISSNDVGKDINVYVMGYDANNLELKPELWISAYPFPYEVIKVELVR